MLRDLELNQYAEERRDRFVAQCCTWLLVLMAFMLLLMALPAAAQGVVPAPTPSGWSPIVLKLLSADWVWNLLGIVGTLVAGKLLLFLHAKEGESKVAKVVAVFGEAAKVAVLEVEQTLRPKVQSALADGVVTPAEAAELKAAAMDIIKSRLPAGALSMAQGVFGPLLEGWLSKQVEAAHAALPAELQFVPPAPAVPAPAPTRP